MISLRTWVSSPSKKQSSDDGCSVSMVSFMFVTFSYESSLVRMISLRTSLCSYDFVTNIGWFVTFSYENLLFGYVRMISLRTSSGTCDIGMISLRTQVFSNSSRPSKLISQSTLHAKTISSQLMQYSTCLRLMVLLLIIFSPTNSFMASLIAFLFFFRMAVVRYGPDTCTHSSPSSVILSSTNWH